MKTAATFLVLVLVTVQLLLLLVDGHAVPRWAAERRGVSSCHKRQAADAASTSCLLQPEVTEGPYYWPNSTVRINITEGKEGVPLVLNMTVVDATTCEPLSDAAVEIWHCDALGVYSHYTSAGVGGLSSSSPSTDNSTFLRGVQLSDEAGLVRFDTIFPGYYVSRDTHIHLKVHLNGSLAAVNQTSVGRDTNDDVSTNLTAAFYYAGGSVVHTGQLFFEDSVSDAVDKLAPYNTNPGNRTLLEEDNIYAGVTNASYGLLGVAYLNASQGYAGGLVATIILGIDTSRQADDGAVGGGPGQPLPPGGAPVSP